MRHSPRRQTWTTPTKGNEPLHLNLTPTSTKGTEPLHLNLNALSTRQHPEVDNTLTSHLTGHAGFEGS